MKNSNNNYDGGWKYVFGCTRQSLIVFRVWLGCFVTLELVLRYRFIKPFYSDEGTLPLRLLTTKVDDLYNAVCFLHCNLGELYQQQILLTIEVILAVAFTLGIRTQFTSIVSWYMYLSLTLRNPWMNYILDRYFHYLLFLSMFLPLSSSKDNKSSNDKSSTSTSNIIVSPATIAFKALVVWIYIDAGGGKLMDPLGGWSYSAQPLPALDTYARHTLIAQYLYALIGPPGLRVMTPIVVWVELLAAPVALLGSYLGSRGIVWTAVILIWSLHIGIALTLRNAALLSFVACVAWIVFLPLGISRTATATSSSSSTTTTANTATRVRRIASTICIIAMVAGNLWLETISRACDQSVKHIWSTLLHNRWNVFVGAEEYVTWEIAPGLLNDGSTVVDVWGRRDDVVWDMPGGGAPCTATARPGRWRSFPYLAELQGEDAEALWSYLCREWDEDNDVINNPERKLLKYNFFMLQADVLPDMMFSATRKRLIHTYECVPQQQQDAAAETVIASNSISPEGDDKQDSRGQDEL